MVSIFQLPYIIWALWGWLGRRCAMSLRSTAETMRPWRSCRCVHGEWKVHQEELRKLSILYGVYVYVCIYIYILYFIFYIIYILLYYNYIIIIL